MPIKSEKITTIGPCHFCNGKGGYDFNENWFRCRHCGGAGRTAESTPRQTYNEAILRTLMEVHPFLLDSVVDLQRSIERATEVLDIVSDILEYCPPAVHAPVEPGTVQPSPEEEISRTVRQQVWPLDRKKPRGPENGVVGSLNEWPSIDDAIQGFKTTLQRMATELIGASVSNKWVDAVVSWLISGVPPGRLAAKSLACDAEPPVPQKPAEPTESES